MRKRPIDVILSPIQQDILAATFDQPERWWYLSELAAYAGRTPSSLQRDLRDFNEGEILESRRDGARLYFRANNNSPLFEPLGQIVNRSLGIVEHLQRSVEPVAAEIEALFIYGSMARGDDGPGSDVDLITVGSIGLAEMSRVLRPLERRFGREFNVSCYTLQEFRSKLKGGNHFLNSLAGEEKVFIIGNENVFERTGRKRPHQNAYDKPE